MISPVDPLVAAICRKEGLGMGDVQVLSGGQVNRVYLLDGTTVLRIGGRADAAARLKQESALLSSLAGDMPVPRVLAWGELDGQAYQVQTRLKGQKLSELWTVLSAREQDGIAAELAEALQVLHSRGAGDYGPLGPDGFGKPDAESQGWRPAPPPSWESYLCADFEHTLAEIRALGLRMMPGFVELAQAYFEQHRAQLAGGAAVLVHSDLTLVNLLAQDGHLTGILDFEFALYAPRDYELWAMEAFCLYPDDWGEEGQKSYCSADFASFLPLLRRHYPALFDCEQSLRERLNLYQLNTALSSYLDWRKDNLAQIPPERMAAKEFYMARITNFLSSHGARMI